MQYVFLIRSRAGGNKYVTRLRLVTYFLPPALERIKNTYCMGRDGFYICINCSFYRATRSAEYAVARCLSVRTYIGHTPVLCLNDYTYPHLFHRRVAP